MTDLNLAAERKRAIAAVTECELEVRRMQENVRHANEILRRAVRGGELADEALADAMRRLERIEESVRVSTRRRAGDLGVRNSGKEGARSPVNAED